MKISFFSSKPYDERSFAAANDNRHELRFFEPRLGAQTANLAQGSDAVCAFVNDDLSRPVLEFLAQGGTKLILMRCAGFDRVDLAACAELGIGVARVPAYSPHAVAEHAVALLLTINRKIHRAYNRVRVNNFALDGLLGFDLYGKTVGVVGTGKIGLCFVKIMIGFGCKVLCYDPFPNPELDDLNVELVELPHLLAHSDVVSLHCPLSKENHHLISTDTLEVMKDGALLINTSRGGLVDTASAIEALKSGKLGGLGLDVYENEAALFFEDRQIETLADDVFARLLTFPNVVITGHQAFFTHEALDNIAQTTLSNADDFQNEGGGRNFLTG